MKRICFLISLLGWLLTGKVATGQPIKSLGLAYELAHVKIESEQVLQRALLKKPVDGNLVRQYMNVKVAFDPIIVQLIAHLRIHNSLKNYKDLDKFVNGNKNLGTLPETGSGITRSYSDAFRKAYHSFEALVNAEHVKAVAIDPIAGATLLYDIIKDIRDTRTKKVENVVALLESLRLSPVDGVDKQDGKDSVGKVQSKN